MTAPPIPTTSDPVPTRELASGSSDPVVARGPPTGLATTLTGLSAVISQLHALGQRHPNHHRLHDRLAPAAAEFEALIHLLLVTADTDPAEETTLDDAPSRRPVPPHAQGKAAFLSWLSGSAPARLPLSDLDAGATAMTRLLASLSSSRHLLPPEAAAALGLPSTATVGQAVDELLLAVTAPAGLRRSPLGSGARLVLEQDDRFAV
jgi:hypothetical protein